jgi:hypothetical protein
VRQAAAQTDPQLKQDFLDFGATLAVLGAQLRVY